ncbi:MAG: NAD(P)/FAD-dependent oxidoreductase [Oscillospiraceae bacterium]|nr:NAD(P)/FAD-dependent oxidoreductase [Oscillospiraceae bacterium]
MKNSRVLVIGMGQGGMIAAYYLAKNGYKVDIFEKEKKGKVSYPWYDDITFNIFQKVGIPAPDQKYYTQKSKWLFVSPDEKNSLAVPPMPPMVEVSVSRRGLNEHLCNLCESVGCKLHYGINVSSLIVENDTVVGIVANKKKYSADLVIDASGLHSPFRGQVPEKFEIQKEPNADDLMSGFRAFYKRNENASTPNPESVLYVKHLNGVGISWCNLNDRNEVDMLFLRIGGMTGDEYREMDRALRKNHDILTDEVIMAPRHVDVGVRYTLARMVADGYAAVGDSAFMTMPFMGSGIEASMQAGKLLAETVIKNRRKSYSAKNLWAYQVAFYKKLGALYMAIDIAKRWALNLDPELINWLFGCGAVTSEDMKLLSTDESNKASISPLEIIKKIGILLSKPSLIIGLFKTLGHAAYGFLVAMSIPKKYNKNKINKWQNKYENLI